MGMNVLRSRACLGVLLAGAACGSMLALSRADEPNSASSGPPVAQIAPACFSPDVRLVIDFQDGTQVVYPRLSLIGLQTEGQHEPKDATVLDVLGLAEKVGGARALVFESTGTGEMTLITGLAGVKNQGAGRDARNWQFWVNDEFSKRGVGAAVVKPGDRVTWAFMTWSDGGPAKRPD